MCGRLCCTLQPDTLARACSTVTPNGKAPEWSGDNSSYTPSTNIAPTTPTPVIITSPDDVDSLKIKVMTWGMVPPWFHGPDPNKHGLSTNNARLENIVDSKLYKPSLLQGLRCVVVCDGFYEWKSLNGKTTSGGGGKQPYLVYAPQQHEPEESDTGKTDKRCVVKNQSGVGKEAVWSEESGYIGQTPLFMAGIYSVWKPQGVTDTQDPLFSYSVITRDSSNVLDWLHERMPVILPDADAVAKWLDPKTKGIEVLEGIQQITKHQICHHPVSPSVGNSRDKSESLMEVVKLDSSGKAKDKSTKRSAGLMANWLNKKPKN